MKLRTVSYIIIFSLCSISCTQDNIQNENCDQLIDEPYDFPLKPGVPEWDDLETEEERINAVQVPEALLKCLTDEALLQTCIDCPLYIHLFASSNPDPSISFGKLVDDFNGLQEFYSRKYIERVLLCRYVMEDIYSFVEEYDVFRLYYFFMFLSRESIISELKKDQVVILIEKSLDYYDAILDESPPYVICCNVVELATVYIMAKVMLYNSYPPFVNYYESMDFINESAVPPDSTTKYARQFIQQ
jgi:hypothetical protein